MSHNHAFLALGAIGTLTAASELSKRRKAGSQALSLEQILAMAEEAKKAAPRKSRTRADRVYAAENRDFLEVDRYDYLEANLLPRADKKTRELSRRIHKAGIPIEDITEGNFDVDPSIKLAGDWSSIHIQVGAYGGYSVVREFERDGNPVFKIFDVNTPAQVIKKIKEAKDSVDEERPLDESDTTIVEELGWLISENLDFDDIFKLHAAGLYRRLEQWGVGRTYEVCVELAEELVRNQGAYKAAVQKGYIPEWVQAEIQQRYGLKP
jgi:hypothetical protein